MVVALVQIQPVVQYASLAQLVEQSAVNRLVVGSNPTGSAIYAGIAQLVEHAICNRKVGGSKPSTSSIKCDKLAHYNKSENIAGLMCQTVGERQKNSRYEPDRWAGVWSGSWRTTKKLA